MQRETISAKVTATTGMQSKQAALKSLLPLFSFAKVRWMWSDQQMRSDWRAWPWGLQADLSDTIWSWCFDWHPLLEPASSSSFGATWWCEFKRSALDGSLSLSLYLSPPLPPLSLSFLSSLSLLVWSYCMLNVQALGPFTEGFDCCMTTCRHDFTAVRHRGKWTPSQDGTYFGYIK